MALAIFTLSILLLNLVFEIEQAYATIPFLRFIDTIEWAFVFPVFIFMFVINQVNHPARKSKKLWWLFVPFGYSITISIINGLCIVAGIHKVPIIEIKLFEILDYIELLFALVFIPAILIFTYKFLKFSIDAEEKKWLTIFLVIVYIFLFSWVIAILIALFFPYDISYIMEIIALFTTFLIHWTAYIGIYKYKLAKDKGGINSLLNNSLLIQNSNITIEISDKKESITSDNHYFKKLEVLCKNQQIYKDSSLNREKVAEMLDISAGYVSQIVNTVTEKNFTNYINQYRVDAVQKMILDSEFKEYSLLSIGLESGFTSKTTFYKSFKKVTGMTPNEYRKSQN